MSQAAGWGGSGTLVERVGQILWVRRQGGGAGEQGCLLVTPTRALPSPLSEHWPRDFQRGMTQMVASRLLKSQGIENLRGLSGAHFIVLSIP